jgi:uncharacterized membrane protein
MLHSNCGWSLMHGGDNTGKTDRQGRRVDPLKSIGVMLWVVALLAAMGVQALAATKQAAAVPVSNQVTYPATQFDDGKARHFQYKTNDGVTIKYFIIKSSDGVIRAAFDACDVCWREGKGYVQKDDFMVCRNCGRRFPSVKVNEVVGGCNPAPLTRKLEGGKVLLKVENILEGKQFFTFGGGR